MSAHHAHTQALNPELPAFQRAQFAFTAHIRAPAQFNCPSDVEERRMAIYRELFFNNVCNFLDSGFPILRSMIDDQDWKNLAHDFFARHISHSPFFTDISTEFVQYLASEKPAELAPTWPFLTELAHYEWMELVAMIADAELPAKVMPADWTTTPLQLSPLAWPLAYNFPVHKIGPEFIPQTAEPTTLVIYRNGQDQVQFLALSGMTYQLLQCISEQALNLKQIAQMIQQQQAHLSIEQLQQGMLPVLTDFIEREIVIPV